jgi:hypothetical protein
LLAVGTITPPSVVVVAAGREYEPPPDAAATVMLLADVVTVTLLPAMIDSAAVSPLTDETSDPLMSAVVSVTAPVLPETLVTGGEVYPVTSAVLIVTAPVRPATLVTAGAT